MNAEPKRAAPPGSKLHVAILTEWDDPFIAELIWRIKKLPCVELQHVLYWKSNRIRHSSLVKNVKKWGVSHLLWRALRLPYDICLRPLVWLYRHYSYAPMVRHGLFDTCAGLELTVYILPDLHADTAVAKLKSLNCDLLVMVGLETLENCILSVPRVGTIHLHQGVEPYDRGGPAGFWELWDNEDKAGVTVCFRDKEANSENILLQRTVPIFTYDTLFSMQKKLDELALSLYTQAVEQLAVGIPTCIKPSTGVPPIHFPTPWQVLRLHGRVYKKQFTLLTVLRRLFRDSCYLIILFLAGMKMICLRFSGRGTLSVLYYHRVTDVCRDGMTISINDFENQIRYLKKHYNLFWAHDLKYCLQHQGLVTGVRNCLITFDDGYEDNLINALPILKKYSCPAIFFVSTGMLDTDHFFASDQDLIPRLRFGNMSWRQLRESLSNQISVGLHSHTHANLAGISHDEAVEEIQRSIVTFHQHLDHEPEWMSYPFGKRANITDRLINYVQEETNVGGLFSATGHINYSPIEPYNIKRVNIGSGDVGLAFLYKLRGGLHGLIKGW
jgi:peptidoglycan/xylan/chitin deacetylase (PgdA/CDA1 family)